MPVPHQKLQAWSQKKLGVESLALEALRVEASQRRFYRLSDHQGHSWIAMASPPALENNEQFLALGRLFQAHRLPVPTILEADLALGYFLLEDLGHTHLEDAYREQPDVLQQALSQILPLQAVRSDLIPDYDEDRMIMEFDLCAEWLLAGLAGSDLSPKDLNTLASARGLLVDSMLSQPQVCVHRDYHCRNLMLREGQLGIVDFQDALIGPALYDAASLLRDCYYTHSEAVVDQQLATFISLHPQMDPAQFSELKRKFDFTAIQRQIKAVGIFARLCLRDEKDQHLEHIYPVLTRVIALARTYPQLAPLAALLVSQQAPVFEALWERLAPERAG